MKILIVDDEYVSLAKLTNLLSQYGACDTAGSGEQAFELFKKAHDEKKPYDLITMDIDLPGIKGQDVVARIREWEALHEIYKTGNEAKILMVTAMSDSKNIMSSFAKGCEDYLIKPFNREKVKKALAKLGLSIPG